jgi:hypothetical protein
MKEGRKAKEIRDKQRQEDLRYEMDSLGFFEPGIGLRAGEVENGKHAGQYIGCLKFDSIEQADMVLAKMNLPDGIGYKSVLEARKKTMVLMDDEGHVLITWFSNRPMESWSIDFEKFLDGDLLRKEDVSFRDPDEEYISRLEEERGKRAGIPPLICKRCGHHWYPALSIIDIKSDEFVTRCPECDTPKRTLSVLTRENGTPVKMWKRPSDAVKDRG